MKRQRIPPDFVNAVRRIVRQEVDVQRENVLRGTKVLIFGPGAKAPEFKLRLGMKKYVRANGCTVNFPEDIFPDMEDDPASVEPLLAAHYNLIFVLLVGPGAISEFSSYINIANLAPRFRVFQESRHATKTSYVNSMVKPFCALYAGYCTVFSTASELRDQVDRVLNAYVAYTFAYRHRPT